MGTQLSFHITFNMTEKEYQSLEKRLSRILEEELSQLSLSLLKQLGIETNLTYSSSIRTQSHTGSIYKLVSVTSASSP